MNSTVFMIDKSANSLTELSQTTYNSEDLFQQLLADHPSLLASAGGTSGRLLLVRREAPVPAGDVMGSAVGRSATSSSTATASPCWLR